MSTACYAVGCFVSLASHAIGVPVASLTPLEKLSPTAARIAAVNTVVVEADGTLSGDNSDGFGFVAALSESEAGWRAAAGRARRADAAAAPIGQAASRRWARSAPSISGRRPEPISISSGSSSL